MTWFLDNFAYVWELTVKHLVLSVIPLVVGFVVALPIGWFASRHRRLRGSVLSVGSLIYTIPSLPLFLVLPSIMGTKILDPLNVIVALSLYAAAVMVRSASDAFDSVPAEVLDASKATGFSEARSFFRVQLPLAGPVLLAGLRVVSVSTVSLVSIGALVGVSSLGSLFTDGSRRDFGTEIIIGIIGVVLIALVLDTLLVLAARLLMPWRSVVRSSGRSV
ncbi:MAG: transporter permease [Nocardioidaceae bacterium]|nr:transporter permease [Nocardioidaceae bacterium]